MRHVVDYIKNHRLVFLTVFLGLIVHLLIILPSGSFYCYQEKCGYFFWGAHGHDAIWHLAIAAVSFNHTPFISPTFFGATLSGYNFLLDYAIYLLSKIGVSPLFSYFKLLPVVWFILFTHAAIVFSRKLRDNPVFISLFLFFAYFGSSFSYLLTYFHRKTIWGSSNLLAMQSGQALINLQYAFSLVVLLWVLSLLMDEKNKRWSLWIGVLTFTALGLKFYAGLITLFTVCIYTFFVFLKSRNIHRAIFFIVPTAVSAILALFLFYDPFNALKTGAALTFLPFATVHPIIEDPAYFYLKDWTDARYYLQSRGFSPRLLFIESVTLLLYIVFNFGVRLVGFLYLGIQTLRRKINRHELTILASIVFATYMSAFFVQKGIWWNTVQFLYYALFLANIFVALFLFDLMKRNKIRGIILLFICIVLTLPANIDLVKGFISFPPSSYLSKAEIDALTFLKNQPEGVVFSPLYDSSLKNRYRDPLPLFAYDDTSYISAFSGKQSYFANIHVLQITGVDFELRLAKLKKATSQEIDLLPVSYIYLPTSMPASVQLVSFMKKNPRYVLIFKNRAALIFAKK